MCVNATARYALLYPAKPERGGLVMQCLHCTYTHTTPTLQRLHCTYTYTDATLTLHRRDTYTTPTRRCSEDLLWRRLGISGKRRVRLQPVRVAGNADDEDAEYMEMPKFQIAHEGWLMAKLGSLRGWEKRFLSLKQAGAERRAPSLHEMTLYFILYKDVAESA